jgi:hypothetical protein
MSFASASKARRVMGILVMAGAMALSGLQGAVIDVELSEVSVTDALSVLARQAERDMEVDASVEKAGARPDLLPWGPPTVKWSFKQVAPEQVLESMAGAYGLVLDRSRGPNLFKLRFANRDELKFKRAARPLPAPMKEQRKVPILFFDEAPTFQVVQTLALQSGLNLVPSYELTLGTNTQGTAWSETLVTVKLRNLTAQQALEAVLDAGGWSVDWSGLGQLGVIYPTDRFAASGKSEAPKPPLADEKTDVVLADLPLEEFIQLMAKQAGGLNWVVSVAARQAVTGNDKTPLMQSSINISQKGVTPLAALEEVLKAKGLQLRWNARAEVAIVDLAK